MAVARLLFVAAFLLLAIVCALVAIVSFFALCQEESMACPGGDANGTLSWQLVVAFIALGLSFPAMWGFTGGNTGVALVLASAVVALLVLWAVLLDLATHGGRFTLLAEAFIAAGVAAGAASLAALWRTRRGT